MKLAITGGGTGGHVYPALEVGRSARDRGADLWYLGSVRGMEGRACAERDIAFDAVPAAPFAPRNFLTLAKGILAARRLMRRNRPDVLFSTGGYSSVPAVMAARSMRIPYIVHDSNSVPGRANRVFAPRAYRFLYVFHETAKHVAGANAERSGQPIRRELREAATGRASEPLVVVVGGSQGSQFLNGLVPEAVRALGDRAPMVVHSTGRANLESSLPAIDGLANYEMRGFLEASEMADVYRRATAVIARSGGTMAEFACFRIPSIPIPLPTSADHHQFWNAREFERMDAAKTLWQPGSVPCPVMDTPEANVESLAAAIHHWMSDTSAVAQASHNLGEWDVPDATDRIVAHIEAAAQYAKT